MLSALKKVCKRIIFSFFTLYGVSLIFNLLDVHIPINIFSLSVCTLLGFPGVISLLLVYVFLL